ncbi:MAG: Gfo/Idh/MocA family oxidoreductase [Tabrizicola sp.]|nr:Gfo/Idh/MocA family oxidoreductase [Tabrizicola sp.]
MRIGLVGCGSWGKYILRDLCALGAEVMVVARSPESRATAQTGGATSIHADVRDLPPADGYVVASTTISHAEIVEALLPTGRPIFVEKPLCDDPAVAQSIADRAGERVFSMDKWRYHAGVVQLAEFHAKGILGQTRHLQSWRLGWHSHDQTSDSIWHLMPHDLSITLEILGYLPAVRQASGFTAFGVHAEASALLQDETGPSVGLHVSGCHPISRRSVLLVGSEGSAQFGDSYDDRIQVRWRDGRTEEVAIATDMPLLAELRVFLDHIRGGPAPKSPAPEAAAIVRHIADIRAIAGLPLR